MTWFWPVLIIASLLVLIVGITFELFDEAEHPHDRDQFGRWS
jgi:hypothetical protein